MWAPGILTTSLAPGGVGPGNHIDAAGTLPYTIRFENDAEQATAPAAMVTVTQSLDPDLDWTTFRLGDLGFGDLIVDVPDDAAFFQTRVDLTGARGVFVDVSAGINAATGEVRWEFVAIDPLTGDLPESPFVGFLPPNVLGPEGEGFVTYTVLPKRTAVTGDRIDAVASIVFDLNDPIVTPPIFNTFDAGAPTSRVTALPPVIGSVDFVVEWSGEDDAAGSGIATYDVFVSENGGPWTKWQSRTTETSAAFHGAFYNTYAFYSVARDNVGHVESAPAVADTQTMTVFVQPGDLNGDLAVGLLDLAILQRNLGASGATPAMGDLSGDGLINRTDAALFALEYGRFTAPPSPAAGASPIAPLAAAAVVDRAVTNLTLTARRTFRRSGRAELPAIAQPEPGVKAISLRATRADAARSESITSSLSRQAILNATRRPRPVPPAKAGVVDTLRIVAGHEQ